MSTTTGDRRTPAWCLDFRLQDVFPPTDPTSIPLLRLAAVANDALFLRRLILQVQQWRKEGAPIEEVVMDGEIAYLFRTLCGHLYEAGRIFQGLAGSTTDQSLAEGDAAALAALAHLRHVYGDASATGFYVAVLTRLRRDVGAEDDEQAVSRAVRDVRRRGQVVMTGLADLNRYVVADEIAGEAAKMTAGGKAGVLGPDVEEAIALAHSLTTVVGGLLARRLERCGPTVSVAKKAMVRIPPALVRARRVGEVGSVAVRWR